MAIGHLDIHQEAMAEIDAENTQKMAEKVAIGATEPGGSPAQPAPIAGPAGMMPENAQMAGQGGGIKPAVGNY